MILCVNLDVDRKLLLHKGSVQIKKGNHNPEVERALAPVEILLSC